MRGALCLALVTACQYEPPDIPAVEDQPDAAISDPGDPLEDPPPTANDTDSDGVPDDTDNCKTVKNPAQGDEDADLVGNDCDNCPHVANADQADVLETQNGQIADAVGDACDPQPTTGGNAYRLFLGFDDASEIADWTFAGNLSNTVAGGKLQIIGTDLAILFKNDLNAANSFVTTNLTYEVIDNTRQFRGATIMTRFRRTTDFGHGAGCGEMRDTAANGGNAFRDRNLFDGAGFTHFINSGSASVTPPRNITYTARAIPNSNTLLCTLGTSTFSNQIASESGTGINLAVWGATVSFHYLVVID